MGGQPPGPAYEFVCYSLPLELCGSCGMLHAATLVVYPTSHVQHACLRRPPSVALFSPLLVPWPLATAFINYAGQQSAILNMKFDAFLSLRLLFCFIVAGSRNCCCCWPFLLLLCGSLCWPSVSVSVFIWCCNFSAALAHERQADNLRILNFSVQKSSTWGSSCPKLINVNNFQHFPVTMQRFV